MKRVSVTVVGLSMMLISLGSSSAQATEGETFKSTGSYTLEIPSLNFVLNCNESGIGKVSVSAQLEMTKCVLEGYGECTVKPFTIELDKNYDSSLFVMTTSGPECFWFKTVDWVPVDFKLESFKEEKGTAKVQLSGKTNFMSKPVSMSIASTWVLGV